MTPEMLTDEKIVAFLDGNLTPEEDAEIALAIANSADVAARVEALALDMDELQAQFEKLLEHAPEMAVPTPTPATVWWNWRVAAAAVVLLAVGAAAGFGLTRALEGEPGWHQAVADYQVLYTNETLAAVPQTSKVQAAGLTAVSTAIGIDLTEDMVAIPGMEFQRAQILSHNGMPLAQLAYLDDAGNPVAFCIMTAQDGEIPAAAVQLSGLEAVTWETSGYGFIVIGPVASDALTRAQAALSAQLQI